MKQPLHKQTPIQGRFGGPANQVSCFKVITENHRLIFYEKVKIMSYNTKNLSVLAYANGFTLWSYTTKDVLEDIRTEGYFNDTSPFVRCGDMILVTANNQAQIQSTILAVSMVADGVVSVQPLN